MDRQRGDAEVARLVRQAEALATQDKLMEALLVGEQALKRERSPTTLLLFGTLLHRAGELESARQMYLAAIASDESLTAAWFNLGLIQHATGRAADAVGCWRRVTALNPKHAQAWCNQGVVLHELGQAQQALGPLRRALELDPDNALARTNLASAAEALNRLDEAERHAAAVIAVDAPPAQALAVLGRVRRRQGRHAEALELVSRALAAGLPANLVGRIEVERGMILDRLGRYAEAFEAFAVGQAALGRLPEAAGIDRAAAPREAGALRAAAGPLLAARPASTTDRSPVFLVGFPRSGTTLITSMLGAHPTVVASDEQPFLQRTLRRVDGYPEALVGLAPERLDELRAAYWEDVSAAGIILGEGQLLLDKLPLNLLHLAGLSHLFPGARVLVQLRDPRDSTLSCFMQDFRPNEAMAQMFTVEGAAAYCEQVLGYWLDVRGRLPLPWIELRYEELVDDAEATLHRALAFLDLAWDDVVLDRQARSQRAVSTPSHHDVTQPVFGRARGRWRRYEDSLEPVLSPLGELAVRLGYDSSPASSKVGM